MKIYQYVYCSRCRQLAPADAVRDKIKKKEEEKEKKKEKEKDNQYLNASFCVFFSSIATNVH